MKRFYEYAGAGALVILIWGVLTWLLIVFLPSPTPAEQAAFERWQAAQKTSASDTGGAKKE